MSGPKDHTEGREGSVFKFDALLLEAQEVPGLSPELRELTHTFSIGALAFHHRADLIEELDFRIAQAIIDLWDRKDAQPVGPSERTPRLRVVCSHARKSAGY